MAPVRLMPPEWARSGSILTASPGSSSTGSAPPPPRPAREGHPAVLAPPWAERDADDPQVPARLRPVGLLVQVEGDLRLGPHVRELKQDLRVAQDACLPVGGQ